MKKFYIIASIFVFIAACDLVVDVNVPKSERKLAVNCFYIDSTWTANVGYSKHILDDEPFEGLGGATVSVTEEETGEIFMLDTTGIAKGYYSLSQRPARYNATYKMQVSKDGFETVYATMTVPPLYLLKGSGLIVFMTANLVVKNFLLLLHLQTPRVKTTILYLCITLLKPSIMNIPQIQLLFTMTHWISLYSH